MPNVEVIAEDLAQIVEAVFENMLDLRVSESGSSGELEIPAGDRISAAVHLSGGWNGAVAIECSRDQAREFACRFLSARDPAVVDEVFGDVLGEVVNMIGGNWKCVLAPGIHLSSPAVNDPPFGEAAAEGGRILERLMFRSPEGVFQVTVLAAA